MPYVGSTAASSLANPPVAMLNGPLSPFGNATNNILGSSAQTTAAFNGGVQMWRYTSSDASTLLQGAGYFTDGLDLGMRIGDLLVHVRQSSLGTSPSLNIGVVVTTNSTAGFNIATGAAIASS